LSNARGTVDQAADAGEFERDRRAWNLPRAPRLGTAASSNQFTNGAATAAKGHSRAADGTIPALPQDLSGLGRNELRKASETRDERLSILFRRWPALSGIELREIRQLHDERQRLARSIGLRNGRQSESRAT